MASIALLTLSLTSNTAQDQDRQALAIQQYEDYLQRGTLGDRVTAFHRLRTSPDAKTLEILIERYDRAAEPKERERYVIAQFASGYWTGKGLDKRLAEWLSRRKADEDLWLWRQLARLEKGDAVLELIAKTAANATSPWRLRAVCLEALAEHEARQALAIATKILADGLPSFSPDRELAYESVLTVVSAFRGDFMSLTPETKESWISLASTAVNTFPESTKPNRASLAAARILTRTLAPAVPSLSRDYWKRRLNEYVYGAGENDRTAIRLPPAAKFAGLISSGHRIAYAIDLSDSMLAKLTETELASATDLLKQALDWKPPVSEEDTPEPLPVVTTRLDLAKALLAASLRKLDKSQEFLVIGFGFEAKPIGRHERFVAATPTNVASVLSDLDKLQPAKTPEGWGAAQGTRPDGQLWGYTNLHGAILKAMQATTAKPSTGIEHSDTKLFETGCDTLFFFSDGAPTWSEFTETRPSVTGETYRDLESGKEIGPAGEKITVIGPYRQRSLLVADVVRMAMLRRVEVNAFGMGETDDHCLRDMAARTHGEVKFLTPRATPPGDSTE